MTGRHDPISRSVTPCEHCGALPRGVGGSTGEHRRDCPGAVVGVPLHVALDALGRGIAECVRLIHLADEADRTAKEADR